MRHTIAVAAVMMAVTATATQPPARIPAPLDLEALITEALERNPGLQALALRAEALSHRVGPAGALMDPMVRLDLSNVPTSDWDFESTPMSGRQLGVTQRLPWPGKRNSQERVAHAVVAAATERARDREGQVVDAVKQAYFELAFLDRAVDVARRNEELLRDFVRIAQTKYAVGRGLQQDVLKAQVSVSSLSDRLVVLGARRRQAEARLNAVLNRDLGAPVGLTPTLTPTPLTPSVDELCRLAVERRPALAAIERDIERWRAVETVARLESRPDFDVTVAYRQRDFAADPVRGSDFLSAGVGLTLPLWRARKQHEHAAEARVSAKAAEAEYDQRRLEVELEIRELYLQVEAHLAQMHLFRTAIIPQAQQSLTAALAGYQVDKVDFLTLLDNQVSLFGFEIDDYRHLTDREKGLAKIEAAMGVRLGVETGQGNDR